MGCERGGCNKPSRCGGSTVPANYCKAKKKDPPCVPCTPCPKRKYKKLKRQTCGSSKVMAKIKPSLAIRERVRKSHTLCVMNEEKVQQLMEEQNTRVKIQALEKMWNIGFLDYVMALGSQMEKSTKESDGKCEKQVGQEESDSECESTYSDISLLDLGEFALTKKEIDEININVPALKKEEKVEEKEDEKLKEKEDEKVDEKPKKK
ncbi:uncharacterized protein LOC111693822 [Trichogramma pretiosum]|uniref:uncharacterized protein LOC111693822 n=1 Tax=Trichogramma pretiosum TaxID=7493 RepID=UPI000C71A6C8|nr:uncharacterized protein LOC111693822 [Trichogramma pretiosum]